MRLRYLSAYVVIVRFNRLFVGVTACLTVAWCSLAAIPNACAQGTVVAEEAEPRYIERVVDFMWTEGRYLWMDSFKARIYPRHPRVGQTTRVHLKIQRRRDGAIKGKVEPTKVEALIRLTGGGKVMSQELEQPGSSIKFEHVFERSGTYSVSLVTHYAEGETYTIAMRVTVERAATP